MNLIETTSCHRNKLPRILTVVLLLLFFTIQSVSAQINLFVSVNGNDNNTGTQASPLKSLTGARNRIRVLRKAKTLNQPVYVNVMDGNYFMTETLVLTEEDSGTPNSPVHFSAYKNSHPVFYGGIEIKGFTKLSEHLWKTTIHQQTNIEQLYVNNKSAVRARKPNSGLFNIIKTEEKIINDAKTKARYTIYPELSVEKIFENFSKERQNSVLAYMFFKWNNLIAPVKTVNYSDNSFTIEADVLPSYNRFDAKTQFYIENSKTLLDTAGEWFIENDSNLYYIPQKGETLENTKFYVPSISHFIEIKGSNTKNKVRYIHFNNLKFSVSASNNLASGYTPMQAAAGIESAITLNFAKNITFNNCEVSQTGQYAFGFNQDCIQCNVVHCYIHHLGAGGIKIGETTLRDSLTEITNHILIDNNIITCGGLIYPEAVGVLIFNSHNNTISHNEISDFIYTGVSVGWVWGYSYSPSVQNKIIFNHIHHLGWGLLSDMAAVYTLGNSQGSVVNNNVVHDVFTHDYGGWGLYADEGTTGITMKNNLVYRCKSGGFHQHYGKNNIISNNIFANNLDQQLQATRIENHLSFSFTNNIVYYTKGNLFATNWDGVHIISDSNCYWNTHTQSFSFGKYTFPQWQQKGNDKHSIIANPLFTNVQSDDFRVKDFSKIKAIHFIPFNYTKAGVYGSLEWKKLSQMPIERIQQFEKLIENYQ